MNILEELDESEDLDEKSETNDLMTLRKEREKKHEPKRNLLHEEQREERLISLRTKQSLWRKGFFNIYKEPWDLWLMINDYLEQSQADNVLPSVPWMLKHLGVSKEKMKEIIWIGDAYSEVFKEWLLSIEDILLRKWLTNEITSKILPLYMKNYHWYTEKSEQTIEKKETHAVNIIVQPQITDKIDWRIIDVDDAEIIEWE